MMISNLLICYCSFDLSCPISEKYIFIENLYIVIVLLDRVLFKPCIFLNMFSKLQYTKLKLQMGQTEWNMK